MNTLSLLKELIRAYGVRMLLLTLASTLAFLTYGVLGAFRYSLNSGDSEVSESRLIVTHKMGLMQTLPLAYKEQLEAIEGVGSVGHATWQGLYYQTQKNMPMLLAVSPQAWFDQHPDMVLSDAVKQRFLREKDGLLVSEGLARKYQWQVGDIIPLKSFIFTPPGGAPAWNYRISGVFHSDESGGGRNYGVTHYEYFDEGRNVWNNTVGTFMVSPTEGTDIMDLAQAIDMHFANSRFPTSSNTDKEFHAEFFAQFGNVVQLISMVTIAVFAALILIVTSGLTLTVRQMSRYLGILRVLGYGNIQLYTLVVAMMMLIIYGGVFIGMNLAAVFNVALTRALPQFLPDVFMPVTVLGEVIVISSAVIIVGTVIPGWLALKSTVLESLNVEHAG